MLRRLGIAGLFACACGVIATRATQPLVAEWPVLVAGDCTLRNGRLTIDADGSAVWQATVRTDRTTSADVWHIAFMLFDEQGMLMRTTPQIDGPRMAVVGRDHSWSATFSVSRSIVPQIRIDVTAAQSRC